MVGMTALRSRKPSLSGVVHKERALASGPPPMVPPARWHAERRSRLFRETKLGIAPLCRRLQPFRDQSDRTARESTALSQTDSTESTTASSVVATKATIQPVMLMVATMDRARCRRLVARYGTTMTALDGKDRLVCYWTGGRKIVRF